MVIIRKNVKDMTPDEKARFIKAVLALKQKKNDKNVAIWDEFVATHASVMDLFSDASKSVEVKIGHRLASFLPWHRAFLFRIEQELRLIDDKVFLPYWDWTDPASTKAVFSPDFCGSPSRGGLSGARVPDGPFKDNWKNLDGEELMRNVGSEQSLLDQVKGVFSLIKERKGGSGGSGSAYLAFTASLEKAHDFIHVWVGGDMSSIKTAVNDPVFYLNHCNVDRLWAMWQDYGNQQSYPISGLSFGNNLNDPLWPWDNGKAVPEADRYKDMIRDWNEVFYTNGSMLNYRTFRFCYDEAKGVLLADKTPQKGNFARPYSPSHLYRLEIKTKATYRMYTTGSTDCSLVLFGPANCADCFGAIRASDDNSGEGGINPSISSALFPGLYYVVIKPSHPTITGAYELKCSTRKDQPVELQLNQAFRASLSQMWEIDWYKFTVTQAGNYIIETTGTTDTMMLLYGPNPPEDLIAVDDDSGEDRNALIKRKLDAKTYHVAIRSQRSSVGKYRVIVRT